MKDATHHQLPNSRITPRQHDVIYWLQRQRTTVEQANNGQWFSANDQINFVLGWNSEQLFRRTFPRCTIIELFKSGFYIKKYRYGRAVHYIASKTQQIDSPLTSTPYRLTTQYVKIILRHSYLAQSSCSHGEITSLETRMTTTRTFNNCGFGSLLAYFCFIDTDHLTNQSGYQIDSIIIRNNPWYKDNMPAIRNSVTGFDNKVCKIIYVKYEPLYYATYHTPLAGRALMYAAFAAGFEELVTYTQNPSCYTNWRRGHIYEVENLVEYFAHDFANTWGYDWYFCKRDNFATLLGLL